MDPYLINHLRLLVDIFNLFSCNYYSLREFDKIFFSIYYFQRPIFHVELSYVATVQPTLFINYFSSFLLIFVVARKNADTSEAHLTSWHGVTILIDVCVVVRHFRNISQFEFHVP